MTDADARAGARPRTSDAPSPGVGLKRVAVWPLHTISSVPVQAIALPSRELSGEGPDLIVLQLSLLGL